MPVKFIGNVVPLNFKLAGAAPTFLADSKLTRAAAINGLFPSQTSKTNYIPTTDGTDITWTNQIIGAKFGDVARAVSVSGSTTSIDLSTDAASVLRVAMGASTTITFSNPIQGQSWTMITTNSAGGYTLAFGNTIKWAGGLLPSRTTTSGAVDVWTFYYDNSTYYGSLSIIDAK